MENRGLATFLKIIGSMILILVCLSVIPAAVPGMLGYQTFHIVSGSMEPAIKVGSAIYVKACNPQAITQQDVIAFYVDGEVVAHRVIQKDEQNQVFYTKGDANAAADLNPVPYQNLIGKLVLTIPYLGSLLVLYTSVKGKASVLCLLLAGLLFLWLSGKIQQPEEVKSDLQKKYQRIKIFMAVIAIALVAVIGIIGKSIYQYAKDETAYEEAQNQYIIEEKEDDLTKSCPITIDFDELKAVNEEIVGWIYCPDTVINYPVCQAADNSYYLNHTYEKKYGISGAVFLEAANASDFSDSNQILYGHHMKNKSMFATLSYWTEQSYYEAHPCMWLLTPEKTYRIDLFAGYTTDALSDTYTVFETNSGELDAYVEKAWEQSDFQADLTELINPDGENKYIVMSTCEYSFENARYVLHGKLVETE